MYLDAPPTPHNPPLDDSPQPGWAMGAFSRFEDIWLTTRAYTAHTSTFTNNARI